MNDFAPILLLVYNRPIHTEKLLDSLKKCHLSDQSDLIIYSDYPKTAKDTDKVADVRKLIRGINWAKSLKIIEQDRNLGLELSVTLAVSAVLAEHDRVIVLEDDLELSAGFLDYMNDALCLYSDQPKVMHISAYIMDLDRKLPQSFFFNYTSSWGWATWRRAWQFYNSDPKLLKKQLKERDLLYYFNFEGTNDTAIQLDYNMKGLMKTWAVKWYASVLLQNGLCLHPGKSFVRNIGFDNSGQNCDDSDYFDNAALAEYTKLNAIQLSEDIEARQMIYKFYSSKKSPLSRFLHKNYTKSPLVRLIFSFYSYLRKTFLR